VILAGDDNSTKDQLTILTIGWVFKKEIVK
jgi:hypothetical protein